jgi:hypothetical protein
LLFIEQFKHFSSNIVVPVGFGGEKLLMGIFKGGEIPSFNPSFL